MTKEELERIKQAYYSGLKVQIWFNGHWENFDARDYSMYSDPFSENRHYRIVGSTYADIAEKLIVELEKEVAKRAEQIEALNKDKDYFSDALDKQIEATYKVVEENKEQLTEAKEHIQTLISCLIDWVQEGDKDYCHIAEAEQFLKELEK